MMLTIQDAHGARQDMRVIVQLIMLLSFAVCWQVQDGFIM
jgi:hypothetical protein